MKRYFIHLMHKIAHSEFWMHCGYCAAVFIEGHGVYALMAGALGIVMLIAHYMEGL